MLQTLASLDTQIKAANIDIVANCKAHFAHQAQAWGGRVRPIQQGWRSINSGSTFSTRSIFEIHSPSGWSGSVIFSIFSMMSISLTCRDVSSVRQMCSYGISKGSVERSGTAYWNWWGLTDLLARLQLVTHCFDLSVRILSECFAHTTPAPGS